MFIVGIICLDYLRLEREILYLNMYGQIINTMNYLVVNY